VQSRRRSKGIWALRSFTRETKVKSRWIDWKSRKQSKGARAPRSSTDLQRTTTSSDSYPLGEPVPKISKTVKRVRAEGVLQGLAKHFARRSSYELGGKVYTREALAGVFQAHAEAVREVDAAHAAVAAAVARERELAKKVAYLTRMLKLAVDAEFGMAPRVWAEFGWEVPKKPGPKTVKAKLEGAEKARATRVARHTMGKRQKRKIRGW